MNKPGLDKILVKTIDAYEFYRVLGWATDKGFREDDVTAFSAHYDPKNVHIYFSTVGKTVLSTSVFSSPLLFRCRITFQEFKSNYMCDQSNNQEIKITKEAILKAASECPDAKRVLKAMFPDIFVEDKSVTVGPGMISYSDTHPDYKKILAEPLRVAIDLECANLVGKAVYLTRDLNWEFRQTKQGAWLAIPTRK